MAAVKQHPLTADYDRAVDVLYLTMGNPQPVEGDGLPGGIELDYAIESGAPCGLTVVGYSRNQWPANADKLADIISDHLSVDRDLAILAVQKALAID